MQRVTLEDFRQMQAQLLEARQALYDSEAFCRDQEKELQSVRTCFQNQEVELSKHRALATFFPSPSEQLNSPGRYPADLNPFGDAVHPIATRGGSEPASSVHLVQPNPNDAMDSELTGAILFGSRRV